MKKKFNWKIILLLLFELSLTVIFFRKAYYFIREMKFEENAVILQVRLQSRHDNKFQLYYSMSEVFDEDHVVNVQVKGDSASQNVDFPIPHDIRADQLRIDMGLYPDTIYVYGMKLIGPNAIYEWSPEKFKKEFRPANQISTYEVNNGVLEVVSTGNDPFTLNKFSTYYLFDSFVHNSINYSRATLYALVISVVFFGVLHFILLAAFKPEKGG